jgi:putative methyltransferase (TIGR04325 family)
MNKKLVKEFLPPVLIKAITRVGSFGTACYWKGNYSTWEDAKRESIGYDSEIILEKVKLAQLKVKRGEVAFERDSVIFHEKENDWPMIAALMWVATQTGHLNVIDFGGSLGSTYFQNISFLRSIKNVKWNVIEQPHFVKCGKEYFQDEQLKYYYDIKSCLKENDVNLVILSGVLPFLEDPYFLLKEISSLNVPFVIIDKTHLIDADKDRITVQHVPASIYKASYPAWFFSRTKFYEFIEMNYEIIADFDREIRSNVKSVFRGFLLSKKN